METQSEVRAARSLKLHPAVAKLFDHPVAAAHTSRLRPVRPVEVLPDGTVVGGVAAVLKPRKQKLNVIVRLDLLEEDVAVVAAAALKDALAATEDRLLLGIAWEAFMSYCKSKRRPRSRSQCYRYVRKHGILPTERLRHLTLDTFGYGSDQLRRWSRILTLPSPLVEVAGNEEVALRPLAELAMRPRSAIDAAAEAIQAGAAPDVAVADALAIHSKALPYPRTVLRRWLCASRRAEADLNGRLADLVYLHDDERAGLAAIEMITRKLMELPSKGEVLSHVLEIYAGLKPSESASDTATRAAC